MKQVHERRRKGGQFSWPAIRCFAAVLFALNDGVLVAAFTPRTTMRVGLNHREITSLKHHFHSTKLGAMNSVDEELDAFQDGQEREKGVLMNSEQKEKAKEETEKLESSLQELVEERTSANFPTLGTVLARSSQPVSDQISQQKAVELAGNMFLFNAVFLGGLTGVAVSGLKLAIDAVKDLLYAAPVAEWPLSVPLPPDFVLSTIPPLVGAAAVCLLRLAFTEFSPGLGGNIEDLEEGRVVRLRPALGKALAAAATLGSGCSLGPEGPAVELGVTVSRAVAAFFMVPVRRQRQLLAAGAAAGVAAGFNAPLAGVFFAFEIVRDSMPATMNDLSKSGVAATLLAAVVSALTARVLLAQELALRPAAYFLEAPLVELPLYLGLGVVAGAVALAFRLALARTAEAFKKLSDKNSPGPYVPKHLTPLIGGLFCSLLSLDFPQILFFGYDTLDKLLANTVLSYSTTDLALFVVLKMVATSVCLGSGLVGGTFAPALFLGATTGAVYHNVVAGFLETLTSTLSLSKPLIIAYAPAYAMVGASAVLSALFRAPLTGSLLMFELTRDYDIILPLMAAAGIASLVVDSGIKMEEAMEVAAQAKKATAANEEEASIKGGMVAVSSEMSSKKESIIAGVGSEILDEMGVPVGRFDQILKDMTVDKALIRRPVQLCSTTSIKEALAKFAVENCDFAIVTLKPNPRDTSEPVFQNENNAKNATSTVSAALELYGVISLGAVRRLADTVFETQEDALAACEDEVICNDKAAFAGDPLNRITIGRGITKNVVAVPRNVTLAYAQQVMERNQVDYLPVVEKEGSKACVGVISSLSIKRAMRIEETSRLLARKQKEVASTQQLARNKMKEEVDNNQKQGSLPGEKKGKVRGGKDKQKVEEVVAKSNLAGGSRIAAKDEAVFQIPENISPTLIESLPSLGGAQGGILSSDFSIDEKNNNSISSAPQTTVFKPKPTLSSGPENVDDDGSSVEKRKGK